MMSRYLRDRYDVESIRLKPETSHKDLSVIEALASIGIKGTVFHVVEFIAEQFEDAYTVLVDTTLVVAFELPRTSLGALPQAVKVWFFAEYRQEIGQGSRRILLDKAADAARTISN